MMLGLGRRKRSDYFSDELNKRHSAFLEDTGKTDTIYQMSLSKILNLFKVFLWALGKDPRKSGIIQIHFLETQVDKTGFKMERTMH